MEFLAESRELRMYCLQELELGDLNT